MKRMADPAARRSTHNPILAIPSVRSAIEQMSADDRARWRLILHAIRDDARARADKALKTHKPPMYVYWKAVGVVCNHLARVVAR
jgi:hypothetical protein